MAKSTPKPVAANIAIVGATTLLGRDLLAALADSNWNGEVLALDTGRGGDEVSYGEHKVLTVHPLENEDLSGFDIVIHAGEARDAASVAKKANAAGAWCVDTSGIYALDPSVPLVMAGVNDDVLDDLPDGGKKIVAVPQALAGALSLALNPLHQSAMLRHVIVSTYQSVGVMGRAGMDELFHQTKKVFMALPIEAETLPKQMAFNCWPMVGDERDDGMTDVEFQAMVQIKKIFGADIKVAVNTVMVPSFTGDGMMVNVDCAHEITAIKAALLMTSQQGLGVVDSGETMATHADVTGEDMAFVARLRNDSSFDNGLSFWLLADNPRAGVIIPLLKLMQKLISL